MSPNLPPASIKPPKASTYAFCTHDISKLLRCKSEAILVIAVITNDPSMPTTK